MTPKVSDAYKEERRKALLDSASHCFAEKGFAETTIDDIVRHSGTSKGAIYNYFASKEEIFIEILEQHRTNAFARLRGAYSLIDSPTKKLRTYMQNYRKLQQSEKTHHFGVVQVEFWLYVSRRAELKYLMDRQYETFMAFFEEIMAEGVEKGEFRADLDVHVAASLFWKLCDGIVMQLLIIQDEQGLDRVLDEAEDLLFRYLT